MLISSIMVYFCCYLHEHARWFRYFMRGSLPWQGLRANSKKQKYQKILEKKLATPFKTLCKTFPKEFCLYLEYCRQLRFEDKPDYSYIKKLFKFVFLFPSRHKSPLFLCILTSSSCHFCLPILRALTSRQMLSRDRDVMVREGYKYDGLYDWVKRKRAEAAVKDPAAGEVRSDRHRSRPSADRSRERGADRSRERSDRPRDRAR